jgi:hypothetical protein
MLGATAVEVGDVLRTHIFFGMAAERSPAVVRGAAQ